MTDEVQLPSNQQSPASTGGPPTPPQPSPFRDGHAAEPEKKPGQSVAVNLAYAVVITALILCAKTFFESTAPGRLAEIGAFEFLEQRISNFTGARLPVVVLDISKLAGGGTDAANPVPTSRPALREIISALVDAHAAVVGVDIDFAPGPAGWISRAEDPGFFDYCLSVNQTTRTKIRLGIFRTRQASPDGWLGLPKYQTLAADLAGTHPEALNSMYRAVQWVVNQEGHNKLPSLGYAMAADYLQNSAVPDAPRWLRPWLIQQEAPNESRSEPSPESQTQSKSEHDEDEPHGRLVNYSKLQQLQTERLRTLHRVSVVDAQDDFTGKIVILGDATQRNGADVFIPPGGDLTPGVFYHASAAYTFAFEPLYEFTPFTRNLLDIALGLPFFAIAVFKGKQTKHAGDEHAEKRWERIEKVTIYASAVAVILLGLAFMLRWRIMWLDFILVIAALAAHPWLSGKAEALGDYLVKRRAKARSVAEVSQS
ncbi:CHASE2 domain-containing protein [Paraburkholderia sp. MPAMCS5]|uniref:CHASE2 domain-containing protein n=1 Tax=Paraburkholderia sp. MPAMCS5 TaxID=3112563 RepID=UPI002E17F4A6|nr:CHASE2 domain-containing protein [Paraburkholderia sp. MPAMCS5]